MIVDGVTYRVPRRKFKSGRLGFMIAGGAVVHGRSCWLQIMVIDRNPLTPQQRKRKTKANREARNAIKARRKQEVERQAEEWRKLRGT